MMRGLRDAEIAALRGAGTALLFRCAGLRPLQDDAVPTGAAELRPDHWEYVLAQIRWVAETAGGGGIGYWDQPGEPGLLVFLDDIGAFHVCGRTVLDHLARTAPQERGSVAAFAAAQGLPAPLVDHELDVLLAGRQPPQRAQWRVTPRRLGFQGHDVGAFLIIGISQSGGLDYSQRLVMHNRCRRLSDRHGIELRCVPLTDMELTPEADALPCVIGHVVAEAYCEDSAPVPMDVDALRRATADVAHVPGEVWTALLPGSEHTVPTAPTLRLEATGPLAGAELGYGILLSPGRAALFAAMGEDPDDVGDDMEPSTWDWDDLKPADAPDVVWGNRLDQTYQQQAVAGVSVARVRKWEGQTVDLSDAAHDERQKATASLAGPQRYWLMAHFGV